MFSIKRALRIGGIVAIAALLVGVGAFMNARSTQASKGTNFNQVTGVGHVGAHMHAPASPLRQFDISKLPNVAPQLGRHDNAMRLPYSAAQYAQIKAAAAHNPNAPKGTDIMPTPHSPAGKGLQINTPAPVTSGGQQENGATPSDMAIAVGDGVTLQLVNETIETLTINESTHALTYTCGFKTLQSFFGTSNSDSVGDPRALYDPQTNRFYVEALDFTANLIKLGVSAVGTSCGTWTIQTVDLSGTFGTEMLDFDTLGMDSEAIYFGGNVFGGSGFDNNYMLACPKSASLCSGGANGFPTFSDGTTVVFTLQPAISYGTPRAETIVNTDYETTSQYTVWTFANPLAIGGPQTVTGVNVGNNAFSVPPNVTDPDGDSIDTGFDNITGQPIWKNGTLYFSLTSGLNNGSATVPGILWFYFGVGLNDAAGGCARCDTIRNAYGKENWQILYGGAGSAYYPSQAVDDEGDVCFTYIFSRNDIFFPAGTTNCRRPTTPRGFNPNSYLLVTASGPYTQGRMGDYTATAFDPKSNPTYSPACMIGSAMYTKTSGANGLWGTSFGMTCFTINNQGYNP